MTARNELPVEPGTRFVWEPKDIDFGPIFMEVIRPKRLRAGFIHFRCIGPDGEAYSKIGAYRLPLPDYFEKRNWTQEDVNRSAQQLEEKRRVRSV